MLVQYNIVLLIVITCCNVTQVIYSFNKPKYFNHGTSSEHIYSQRSSMNIYIFGIIFQIIHLLTICSCISNKHYVAKHYV